jgi:hypothetical protein
MSKGTTRYLHGFPMAFLSIKDGTTIHSLQFRVDLRLKMPATFENKNVRKFNQSR